MSKIIELIYSEEERRGKGTQDEPIRLVRKLFTKDGILVAEDDMGESFFRADLIKNNDRT